MQCTQVTSIIFTIGAVISFSSADMFSSVNCNFDDTEGLPLCGWTPKSAGGAWQIGTSGSLTPPIGLTSYAFIRSGQESWAELESQNISLTQNASFSFKVYQQRIALTQEDLVELLVVRHNDESACNVASQCRRWGIQNSVHTWTSASIKLTPELGVFQLRFRFKVGNERQLAALSSPHLALPVHSGFVEDATDRRPL